MLLGCKQGTCKKGRVEGKEGFIGISRVERD